MGELLSDVLGAHAFEVLVSQTGNDALATVAQRADIALVLLDMILPDTHGPQVFQQLQRTRPELPVVMLSVWAESDVVVVWRWAPMITSPNRSARGWWSPGESGIATQRGALAGEASGAGAGLTFNGWRPIPRAVNCITRSSRRSADPCGEGGCCWCAGAERAGY